MLTVRFFQIQVLEGERFALEYKNQCWNSTPIQAHRGSIYDRNGKLLAFTVEYDDLFVKTDSSRLIHEIATQISPILNIPGNELYNKITSAKGGRVCIGRKLDPVTAGKIRTLGLKGLNFETRHKREYPYPSAATFLGYINHESEAMAGAELYCDDYLRGKDGLQTCIKDASGVLYPVSSHPDIPPEDGYDVYLTIDIDYQQILQEEIDKAVEKWNARAGLGVFMDAQSGKILALYHLDTTENVPENRYPKTRAITDLFEPGSTFKTVVFAALLEEGLIDLSDTIFAGHGKFKFNGRTLHDDKELDTITQAEAFILSSNIATGRLAQRLGPKGTFRYAREFGFGLKSGLDFPGEVNGRLVEPEVWSEYYCALLSIGHGISTSALQMARVFGCVANGGSLMRPMFLERVISPVGGTIKRFYPEKIRRIFSQNTATKMRDLCAIVVDTGTAKYALIDGITFSGKTGTAEKPSAEGGYDKNRYIASFGGFFPRENPRICGIVLIDEPQKINYGGITAGPAFANAAKRIMELEIRRQGEFQSELVINEHPDEEIVNPVSDKDLTSASDDIIKNAAYSPVQVEKGELKGELKGDSSLVYLPNFEGISVRAAVPVILAMDLECTLQGDGTVISTVPPAGSLVKGGQRVTLICSGQSKEVAD